MLWPVILGRYAHCCSRALAVLFPLWSAFPPQSLTPLWKYDWPLLALLITAPIIPPHFLSQIILMTLTTIYNNLDHLLFSYSLLIFTMFAPWEQKCSCLTYLTPRVVKECGINIIDVFQVVHAFEECNLVKVCNPNRVFSSPGLNDFIGYAYTCFHPFFKEQSNITSVSPSAIISRVCFWVLNFSLVSFHPSPCNSLCHYFSHQMCVHFVS